MTLRWDGCWVWYGCSIALLGEPPAKAIAYTIAARPPNRTFNSVILLLLLVARSKLVPDFALTLHVLHLIATSVYTRSFPTNVLWWILQGASAALMASLGVWSCRWRELKPINFGGNGGGRVGNGEDGYELVGMKDGDG